LANLAPRERSDVMFKLWVESAEAAYDQLEQSLEIAISRMKAMGMSNKEILSRLEMNMNHGTDIFGKFEGNIEGQVDHLVGGIAQADSNTFPDEEMLQWELEPGAEHCETCLERAAMAPKSFVEWADLGLPGAGNTECDGYCRCTLLPETAEVNA
jgi:hypothetical protein